MTGKAIPKPKDSSIFGYGSRMKKNPLKFLADLNESYPGIVGYFTQTDHPFLLQIDHPKQTTI